jgi:hypothetical protein
VAIISSKNRLLSSLVRVTSLHSALVGNGLISG